jgi:hypothetical protein
MCSYSDCPSRATAPTTGQDQEPSETGKGSTSSHQGVIGHSRTGLEEHPISAKGSSLLRVFNSAFVLSGLFYCGSRR